MTEFPANPNDTTDAYMRQLGDYWTRWFGGVDEVRAVVEGIASRDRDILAGLERLIASVAVTGVEPFRRVPWSVFRIFRREVTTSTAYFSKFDAGDRFDTNGEFDSRRYTGTTSWLLPADIKDVGVVCNRYTAASATFVCGVECFLDGGYLHLPINPFDDPRFYVNRGATPDDDAIDLLLWSVTIDKQDVQTQFGHVLGASGSSSAAMASLVRQGISALTAGGTELIIRSLVAAATDVPLVMSDEVVEIVTPGFVATDRNVYHMPPGSSPTVSPGQRLETGDTVCNAVTFYRPKPGGVIPIPAIAIGPELLGGDIKSDLVFENRNLPVTYTPRAGLPEIRWPVGGWTDDVDEFFSRINNPPPGVKTLTRALDPRGPDREDEPPIASLPSNLNPASLLLNELLQGSLFFVVIRAGTTRPRVSLGHALRLSLPAWVCALFHVILNGSDTLPMSGEGSPQATGYKEMASSYFVAPVAENVSPAIAESVVTSVVEGQCL
jgi:hypothetical protein